MYLRLYGIFIKKVLMVSKAIREVFTKYQNNGL
jgi:hypothetical protein